MHNNIHKCYLDLNITMYFKHTGKLPKLSKTLFLQLQFYFNPSHLPLKPSII